MSVRLRAGTAHRGSRWNTVTSAACSAIRGIVRMPVDPVPSTAARRPVPGAEDVVTALVAVDVEGHLPSLVRQVPLGELHPDDHPAGSLHHSLDS